MPRVAHLTMLPLAARALALRTGPLAFVVALFVATMPLWAAAPPGPVVFSGAPAATWIAHPTAPGDAYGVYYFRRELSLPAKPARFVVHVSGDNRYRLLINGRSVATGPQRSDLQHWRYETVDLAPHLQAGTNVLTAIVWNWGALRPVAQFTQRTAFLLQADSPAESVVNTGPAWRVHLDAGRTALPINAATIGGYYAAPPGEAFDATSHPWGWEKAGFDDRPWPAAVTALPGAAGRPELRATHSHGEAGGWQLVPRTLPPMEESPVRFARIRRADGLPATDDGFLRGETDLVVAPRTKATLLLDHAHLTTAFAVLETSGGRGALLTLTYAEALKDARGQKGNRNDIEGKSIAGLRDTFRPDGGAHRHFQTLWFRTYRYVQLEIQTADEPLRVHDLHGIFTAYPFEEKARFACALPWIADMWTMNWRVARLCAGETYFDTPYYEQLQYVGDTRIQSLISLYMSGDDRLVRQALFHFDQSRIPDGLTGSRAPSSLGQYIPPFSLIWVAMVHDFWMHRDDAAFVRSFLPGIRAVLGYYERALDETGLVGPMPWWNFADWAPEWKRGVPPGGDTGGSALITLQFVYALQRAAELESALGQPAEATRLRALADRIRSAVRTRTWDATRGLLADAPGGASFSQQTNTLAILTDTVPAPEQRAVMEHILGDAKLVRATYYFSFYVCEALRHAGLGDRYLAQLAPWQEMLRLGLTTTPEQPDPTRSDSHAWSAHPNYGLLATVLGVRPNAPGFRSVLIAPHLGELDTAEGRVPHPLGDIAVRFTRTATGGLKLHATLPDGLDGVFAWRGRRAPLRAGVQDLEL